MFLNNLRASLPDTKIEEQVSLSPLCTLGVGGVAEVFAEPPSIREMQDFIRGIKDCPVYVLGGGSNVVISDGTISGVVISTRKLDSITWLDNETAEIQAGCKLSTIIKDLREKNLGGLEFAAGIPGTLGGAICGNAGAGGHGVCELIEEVTGVDFWGNIKKYTRDDFDFSYRKCSLAEKKIIIASVKMKFHEGFSEEENERFMSLRKNQPAKFKSAGCTFKNPDGYSAGRLLDECGCKNLSVGDAVVSDVHANFILNRGSATGADIMELIKVCGRKVYDSTGIRLEPEVRIFSPCFFV